MSKYRVKEDCYCQGYLHENIFYPRKNLIERKLFKNDVVELKQKVINYYGIYLQVKRENEEYGYDVFSENLEIIKETE